jgi:hypothetical protein
LGLRSFTGEPTLGLSSASLYVEYINEVFVDAILPARSSGRLSRSSPLAFDTVEEIARNTDFSPKEAGAAFSEVKQRTFPFRGNRTADSRKGADWLAVRTPEATHSTPLTMRL